MTKEMILMNPVQGLGDAGDVVQVADGYARNYLIPRGLAAPVTEASRRRIEKLRRQREAEVAVKRKEVEGLAERIEQTSCTIAVQAGPGGKLFGSVGAADIVESLKEQALELDRRQVDMDEPLRELGVFKVPIKVGGDTTATLKVWVVEE